eukprot:750197_1
MPVAAAKTFRHPRFNVIRLSRHNRRQFNAPVPKLRPKSSLGSPKWVKKANSPTKSEGSVSPNALAKRSWTPKKKTKNMPAAESRFGAPSPVSPNQSRFGRVKPIACTKPVDIKTLFTKPSVTKSGSAVSKPDGTKPVVTTPVVTTPVVTKPVVTKPVVTKPVVTKPVTTMPSTTTPIESASHRRASAPQRIPHMPATAVCAIYSCRRTGPKLLHIPSVEPTPIECKPYKQSNLSRRHSSAMHRRVEPCTAIRKPANVHINTVTSNPVYPRPAERKPVIQRLQYNRVTRRYSAVLYRKSLESKPKSIESKRPFKLIPFQRPRLAHRSPTIRSVAHGRAESKPVDFKPVEINAVDFKPTQPTSVNFPPHKLPNSERAQRRNSAAVYRHVGTKSNEVKPVESKTVDSKPVDSNVNEFKPAVLKAANIPPHTLPNFKRAPRKHSVGVYRRVDAKAVDSKVVVSVSSDMKPVEPKIIKSKPSDLSQRTHSVSVHRRVDANPVDSKPVVTKPDVSKP